MARKIEHSLDVVGIPYRGFKREDREALAAIAKKKKLRCDLQREPTNKVDYNAILVVLCDTRAKEYDGRAIGYLRAPSAEVLAPRIDEGAVEIASCFLTELFASDDNKSGNLDLVIEEL